MNAVANPLKARRGAIICLVVAIVSIVMLALFGRGQYREKTVYVFGQLLVVSVALGILCAVKADWRGFRLY